MVYRPLGQKEAAVLDPIAFMQATKLAAEEARSARPDRPAGPRPRRRKKA
jgi:hypothetical protein